MGLDLQRRSAARWACALSLLLAVLSGCDTSGDCEPGTLDCPCLEEGTCGEAKGDRLLCEAGVCRAPSCAPGTEGCPCLSGACNTGSLVCHADVCVKANCTPGQAGCPCGAEGSCSFGECREGFCVAGEATDPPAAPSCYTPCQSGLNAGGTYTACPDDGLMPRCLDGKGCTDGSCVEPGAAAPTCEKEIDCPDFQTCIQGKCYSNCDSNDDCMGGRECFRHVCRAPCRASLDSCPTQTACVTQNGDTGFCMPIRALSTPSASVTPAEGTFQLSGERLAFSSAQLSGSVLLTNRAPIALEFKVRKLDHTESTGQGPVRITDNPLAWVSIGTTSIERVAEFTVLVEGNGGTAELSFGTAANPDLAHWEGRVEVETPTLGKRVVHLSYVSRPEGRWAGKMYSFASFGDAHLAEWTAQRDDATALARVGNAFIQRWGALRQGRLSHDELQAVLASTLSESWKWDPVREGCVGAAACYPYSSASGFGTYSDSLESYPIPTASSELPIAFNLQADPADPLRLVGKIVTEGALQYAGDPALSLSFAADPSACKAGVTSACFAPLGSLSATVQVGGRYVTTKGDTACSRAANGTFAQVAIPWLIPGFHEGTSLESSTGLRYRYECRDQLLPLGSGTEVKPLNLSFAQSNPIPDGRPRVRRLELVDGGLINQESMVIIFRERFTESFLGVTDTQGFSAYGVMVLKRQPAELDAAAYVGSTVTDTRTPPAGVLNTSCSADVVTRVLGSFGTLAPGSAEALAVGVLDGLAPGSAPIPLDSSSPVRVHYLCHETGLFDGGREDTTALNTKEPCPAGSGVTWFTASTTLTRDAIAQLACQQGFDKDAGQKGTCQATLDSWKANGAYGLRLDPIWRCTDPNRVYCDDNRLDLRNGKQFFLKDATTAVYVPLLTAIDSAFRYKTQFQGRDGTSVGFAPEICVPNSNAIPYCYDPAAIEEAKRRTDCALELFSRYSANLSADTRGRLKAFLTTDFGYAQENTPNGVVVKDGFERLNAELLIMQGDEAYTQAFASRFDLAGSRMVSFQGTLFEAGGINLAGGAGNEMYNLYQATQYYQLVLDRFYSLSPFVWQSVQGTSDRNFITKETVVSYFDRLIRASTQKARAWSEVSKRYQSFNRPDLARHVVQRAYSAAYLESIVLSRMILRVVSVADPADRAFITSRAELATLGYKAALLDMREVYASIQDQRTFFGDAPDFIPFPALEPGDVNAFAKLLNAAKQSASVAGTKEEVALASNRSFDTDAAQFQSELIRIRNNYENQLSDLCGNFAGDDGRIYPAIRTYGYLDERTRLMGDPCGLVGNGRVHDAMAAVEITGLELKTISQRIDNVLEEMSIEAKRVGVQCQLNFDLAQYKYEIAGQVNTLQSIIRGARVTQSVIERGVKHAEALAEVGSCEPMECPSAAVGLGAILAAYTGSEVVLIGIDAAIVGAEAAIDTLQQNAGRWEIQHQCQVFFTDARATIDRLALEIKVLELEALKTDYRLRLDLAQIQKLRNDATRLLAEKEEIEAQTINVEAARSDPNVRIYKNDAVILSDQTFGRALQDAYRATKVFEYYTSQSYAKLGELFLIRMVSHGDYNLETYLIELESAYREFQQGYGNPDTRVEVISLRDDVLAIPRMDATGRSLSQAERTALFRERLGDSDFIDQRGYVTMPFTTTLARLSPLTRNHKVLAMEAELIGTDVGDTIARLYVRQRGTGTVHSVTGEKNYYRFPERTAVLNPFVNGVRVYTPELYRSERLRDRPFVNTHWELVINQKDEQANKDIKLQSLTDVRLYVYYSDFTRL